MKIGEGLRQIVGWDSPADVPASLVVPLRTMRRLFAGIVVVLVPINLVIGWLKWLGYEIDEQPLATLVYLDLGEEQNFSAWFASVLLVVASLAAYSASQHALTPLQRRGFRITSAALLYVSLDEATYLHERASNPLREWLGVGGIFLWAWVIPAIVVVAVLARTLWPFLQELPRHTAHSLFLSAGIFVGCAAGIEMLDGWVWSRNNGPGVITELLTIVEEIGEMAAVMIFIDAVLRYCMLRGTVTGHDEAVASVQSESSS